MTTSAIGIELKRHFQMRILEWWSAAALASWGFYCLLIPSLFNQNPFLGSLLTYAPQHIWGLAALIAGVIRLMALTINGFWHKTPAIRWLTSMVSALSWFSISTVFLVSDIPSPSIVFYVWLVLADVHSAFRSASDYVETAARKKAYEALAAEESNVRSFRS